MDVIPSLCACTASCGAAAVGYSYARQKQPRDSSFHDYGGSLNDTALPNNTSRDPPSRLLPPDHGQRVRPKSANFPQSSPSWTQQFERKRGEELVIDESVEDWHRETLDAFDVEEDITRTGRSLRFSTRSNISPSRDGSSVSTPRPSTPSVFSNRSNTPLITAFPVALPRNRLVKRSTSQRILESGGQGAPIPHNQTLTFRRPATSHQLSEHLRNQSVQQSFQAARDSSSQNSPGSLGSLPSSQNNRSQKSWEPYFLSRIRRIVTETSFNAGLKGPSALNGASIRCAYASPGSVPTLVKSVNSTKASPHQSEPTLESIAPQPAQAQQKRAAGPSQPRRSFSIGGLMSSNPTRRRRSGSLVIRKSRESQGNRSSNDPKPSDNPEPAPVLPPVQSTGLGLDIIPNTATEDQADSRRTSRPASSTAGVPSKARGAHTSRVPSEQDSTALSSDNEQSRVFSTDDDTDYRSETVYDSIRTEASGNTHSTHKGQPLDSVFVVSEAPQLHKHNLDALQEKLSEMSLSDASSRCERPPEQAPGQNRPADSGSGSDPRARSGRTAGNLFEWSERSNAEGSNDASARPTTAYVSEASDRPGRPHGRRLTVGVHMRSQSVPVANDAPHRLSAAAKVDAWVLGGKGVSEDWDGDFDFEEAAESNDADVQTASASRKSEQPGVVVPSSILESQANVHNQFGHVKELTMLVEELKRLRRSAQTHGILNGQASELWKEAEGIIELANTDDEELSLAAPTSPTSTTFDFDAFDDEPARSRNRAPSISHTDGVLPSESATVSSTAAASSSGSRFGGPSRARNESTAKAKHVLENISQRRGSIETQIDTMQPSQKLPFDTTSLRDLVTRAGVVTRALKEIIRKIEHPNSLPGTPEKRVGTPPDPPFSQIFQQGPSSPSSRVSPKIVRRGSNNSFPSGSAPNSDNDLNGKMKLMTAA